MCLACPNPSLPTLLHSSLKTHFLCETSDGPLALQPVLPNTPPPPTLVTLDQGSQTVVPQPAISASPENLLEKQIPGPAKSETRGLGVEWKGGGTGDFDAHSTTSLSPDCPFTFFSS